jgi:hypothetical protein
MESRSSKRTNTGLARMQVSGHGEIKEEKKIPQT